MYIVFLKIIWYKWMQIKKVNQIDFNLYFDIINIIF